VVAVADNALDVAHVPAAMHMLRLVQACGATVGDDVEA
jgi:hypothetical protein